MKKLLIILYVLTILWAITGSVVLPVYCWRYLLEEYPIIQIILLPVMILITITIIPYVERFYEVWWNWMFNSKN